MASKEGFLTEEQREKLKLASLSVENISSSAKGLPNLASPRSLSSSPRSSNMFPAESYAKAPGGGGGGKAGVAAGRHVRRSHSGKLVRVKKGEKLQPIHLSFFLLCFCNYAQCFFLTNLFSCLSLLRPHFSVVQLSCFSIYSLLTVPGLHHIPYA